MGTSDQWNRCEGQGAELWAALRIPSIQPEGWEDTEIRAGIRELERLRREADAAMALLVGALPRTRDGIAQLARICGISNREARNRHDVARVVRQVRGAREALASGKVSSEHVAALVPLAGREAAEELLELAERSSPEEFRELVEQRRIFELGANTTRQRQRERRALRFFNGPEGMVGLNGLLPPIEGNALKQKLCALTDARWREAHPDRAPTLGAHGGDSREQRMADALLELTGVNEPAQTGCRVHQSNSSSSNDSQCAGNPDVSHVPHAPHAPDDPRYSDVSSRSGAEKTSDAQREVDVQCSRDVNESTSSGPRTLVKTAKPAVVIVFDIDRYEASLLGHGPIPVHESLFDSVKHDLYVHFMNNAGEVLNFGRARRDPTLIQKLAVMVRDRRCQYPGCTAPPAICEFHHFNEWLKDEGQTDVRSMGLMCRAHHRHVHLEDLVVTREGSGQIGSGQVSVFERDTGKLVARTGPVQQ